LSWKKKLFNLFADLGDWLTEEVKNRDNAIIVGILCIFSPLNMVFAVSFIASVYRKSKRRK
jgi:hypothetical protein